MLICSSEIYIEEDINVFSYQQTKCMKAVLLVCIVVVSHSQYEDDWREI